MDTTYYGQAFKYTFLRLLRKLRILRGLNIVLTNRYGKELFRIPILQGIGINHFEVDEEWMSILISKLLKIKQGAFLDVGVNIGQTLLKVKKVARNIPYYGFEPNPRCVNYVTELIRLNSFRDVSIYPVGIFSFDGLAHLFVNPENSVDSCATLLQNFRNPDGQNEVTVPVISKDSLKFLLNEHFAIIKIDVEGSELEVIQQLEGIIRNHRPFIICEILPPYGEENTFRISRQEQILELLKLVNYCCWQAGEELRAIDQFPIISSNANNYLFVPIELEKQLQSKHQK